MYAVNTAEQDVAVGGNVNFGSLVRRFGCNVGISGGEPIVSGCGYYDIDTNFTFTAGAAGTITITLMKGGVPIPGAFAQKTVADGSIYDLNVPALIKHCCECETTVTAQVTGVAATFNNATMIIEKV